MVFCFLSTGVLYVVSMIVLILSCAMAVLYYDTAMVPCGTLIVISMMAVILAHITAKRLYDLSMSRTIEGFDPWYAQQKGIVRRSFRSSRMAVLLNIAYVCSAFERTEECRAALTEARPLIDRYGNAYYRYIYLMAVLSLKEKTHDMTYVSELVAEIYALIKSPLFPKYESREECLTRCDYALAELQVYTRSPEQLAAGDNEAAIILHDLAIDLSQELTDLSERIGYGRLAYHYNAGLTSAILGDASSSEAFFGYIASAPYDFPIVARAREYLLTGDVTALMETIP